MSEPSRIAKKYADYCTAYMQGWFTANNGSPPRQSDGKYFAEKIQQAIDECGYSDERAEQQQDDRTALRTLAYMLRDAGRKLESSRLQSDHDEFERLIGFLNLPEGRLLEAIKREVQREAPTAAAPQEPT